MQSRNAWLGTLAVLFLIALAAPTSAAEPWPARPVRIVVPFPAGGPNDLIARLVAIRLTRALDQQFIVDNRSGASGMMGTESVAKAKPDGYTLLISGSGPIGTQFATVKNIPYHMSDFAPITPVAYTDMVLVASAKFAPNTLAEVIAAAKVKPQGVKVELNSFGSMHQLFLELLQLRAGVTFLMVPYKGSAPAVTDLVAGHVDMGMESTPSVIDLIRAGRVKAIAVAGSQRADTLPDVPTFKELGMPEFVAAPWTAMVAPKDTPPEIIEKLSKTLKVELMLPEVKAQFAKQGMATMWMTPEEAERFLVNDIARWIAITKEPGVRMNY